MIRKKPFKNKNKKGESGQALILVLAMLALGSLIIVPVLNLSGTSVNYHREIEENTQETYAADSGFEYALCKLGNDPETYKMSSLDHDCYINSKAVHVIADYLGGDNFKITSTATTDSNSSTTIESYIHIIDSICSFDNAITALDGNANVQGDSQVTSFPDWGEANVYANGDVNLDGQPFIDGDITATGSINTGSATITGVQTPYTPDPITFRQLDPTPYIEEADAGSLIEGDLVIDGGGYYDLGPAHITGNLSIAGNRTVLLYGTVYVEGTVYMAGKSEIEGPGTLVAVGDITIRGNRRLNPDEIPFVWSVTGSIYPAGTNWISAVLYAPNGTISLEGNRLVYGCVVGKEVNVTGTSQIDYPVDLRNRDDLPDDSKKVIIIHTWQISN